MVFGSKRNVKRLVLWIDGVGSRLICLQDEIVLGREAVGGGADIAFQAELAKRHVRLRRDGEGYMLEAFHPTWVDGRPVQGVTILPTTCTIRLGEFVALQWRRPNALAGTACLMPVSRHRVRPGGCDGAVLWADTCILGPKRSAHVLCRIWERDVILFRQDDGLFCRAEGKYTVDGRSAAGRTRLRAHSRVEGEDFAFYFEPVDER
ncbi:hypothetical protein JCM19992_30940 [Thermostilla marina]